MWSKFAFATRCWCSTLGPRSLADFSSTSDRNVELNYMSVILLTSSFVLEFIFCTNTQIISRVPYLFLFNILQIRFWILLFSFSSMFVVRGHSMSAEAPPRSPFLSALHAPCCVDKSVYSNTRMDGHLGLSMVSNHKQCCNK